MSWGLKKATIHESSQIGELLYFNSMLSVLDKNIYIHFLSYQLQHPMAEQNRLMPSRQVVVLGYARIPWQPLQKPILVVHYEGDLHVSFLSFLTYQVPILPNGASYFLTRSKTPAPPPGPMKFHLNRKSRQSLRHYFVFFFKKNQIDLSGSWDRVYQGIPVPISPWSLPPHCDQPG